VKYGDYCTLWEKPCWHVSGTPPAGTVNPLINKTKQNEKQRYYKIVTGA